MHGKKLLEFDKVNHIPRQFQLKYRKLLDPRTNSTCRLILNQDVKNTCVTFLILMSVIYCKIVNYTFCCFQYKNIHTCKGHSTRNHLYLPNMAIFKNSQTYATLCECKIQPYGCLVTMVLYNIVFITILWASIVVCWESLRVSAWKGFLLM